jgi:hypothetical protein
LRGEGWGEGLLQQVLTRGEAPSPEIRVPRISTSPRERPRAGRGDELARLVIQLKVIPLWHKTGSAIEAGLTFWMMHVMLVVE